MRVAPNTDESSNDTLTFTTPGTTQVEVVPVQFTVTDIGSHAKAAFPTAAVYGDLDHPGLRLITCGGPLDPRTGNYRDNVVLFATMVAAS